MYDKRKDCTITRCNCEHFTGLFLGIPIGQATFRTPASASIHVWNPKTFQVFNMVCYHLIQYFIEIMWKVNTHSNLLVNCSIQTGNRLAGCGLGLETDNHHSEMFCTWPAVYYFLNKGIRVFTTLEEITKITTWQIEILPEQAFQPKHDLVTAGLLCVLWLVADLGGPSGRAP